MAGVVAPWGAPLGSCMSQGFAAPGGSPRHQDIPPLRLMCERVSIWAARWGRRRKCRLTPEVRDLLYFWNARDFSGRERSDVPDGDL